MCEKHCKPSDVNCETPKKELSTGSTVQIPLNVLLFPCLYSSSDPLLDIYSSIRALMSSMRVVFLSVFVEPKAFSTRSCFCLWIFTMLSSTEPFTMNLVTTTFLVCPRRWQRSMHCSSVAGFHAGSMRKT